VELPPFVSDLPNFMPDLPNSAAELPPSVADLPDNGVFLFPNEKILEKGGNEAIGYLTRRFLSKV
jgi:hypothetical protein